MGTKKYPTRKNSNGPIIATIIVAVAAIAAIGVFFMSKMNNDTRGTSQSTSASFNAPQELITECEDNARALITKNYEVISLFVTQGVSYLPEPYGNSPETGYYEVDSERYKTFEQIEELVKSVYTAEEAQRVLTAMPAEPSGDTSDSSADSADLIAVYAARSSYSDGSSVLGINERFKPFTDYDKQWNAVNIEINPVSEEECKLTVLIGRGTSDTSSEDVTFNTLIVKENGEWRLSDIIY